MKLKKPTNKKTKAEVASQVAKKKAQGLFAVAEYHNWLTGFDYARKKVK